MRIIRCCTIVGTVLCVVGLSIMWFQEPVEEEKQVYVVAVSKKEYLGTYPLKEIIEEPAIERLWPRLLWLYISSYSFWLLRWRW